MNLTNAAGTLTRLTDGASEVLSLTDLKTHLRIDETADHDFLLLTITAVRRATEEFLGRTLIDSNWTLELDHFPAFSHFGVSGAYQDKTGETMINLPMGPVTAIGSVQYRDSADTLQTMMAADYQFDRNGRLLPVSTKVWPATYDRLNAVIVTYTSGAAHAGEVEEDIKHAMRLMIGHFDKNRENTAFSNVLTIPDGFKFLLNPHRLHLA